MATFRLRSRTGAGSATHQANNTKMSITPRFNRRRWILSAVACTAICVGRSPDATAQQVLTVGSLLGASREISVSLDRLASASLTSGPTLRARRQLLLAGILGATTDRLLHDYAGVVNRRFEDLPSAQVERLRAFNVLLNTLGATNTLDDDQILRAVADAARIAHDALDVSPSAHKPPLLFGLATAGVLNAGYPNASTLVVLGYHLIDPSPGSPVPVVMLDGSTMPANAVRADFSKIVVDLSSSKSVAKNYEDSPCRPLKKFTVAVAATYTHPNSLLGRVGLKTTANLSIDAVASPEWFEFVADVEGLSATAVPFFATSRTNTDCDSTTTAVVNWEMPQGAKLESEPRARWVVADRVRAATVRVEKSAGGWTAFGTLSGNARVCALPGLCICPGGGFGVLALEGVYAINRPLLQRIESPTSVTSGDTAVLAIPKESEVAQRRVRMRVYRRGCERELDVADLSSDALASGVTIKSHNGLFEVVPQDGQLLVRLASAAR